jgi:hypothetical protein
MRIIDRKWIDLATGYRILLSLKSRLENEFGRALQVSLEKQYEREIAEWQKKRRVFIGMVVLAPLSLIILCLAAFYFKEVSCVLAYWVVVVLIILVTLGVAGRSYIKNMVNKPELGSSPKFTLDLEERWWLSLTPKELALQSKKGDNNLLNQLSSLANDTLGIAGPPSTEGPSFYLFAPSGPWLFTVRDWTGVIVKEDGLWKQMKKRGEPLVYVDSPDDQWFVQKEKLAEILSEHFPQTAGTIQGGVAFSNPEAQVLKDRILGNRAPCGSTSAWMERLRSAAVVEGLTLDMQLKTLDSLLAEERAGTTGFTSASARVEAMRLYQEIAEELRLFISKRLANKAA